MDRYHIVSQFKQRERVVIIDPAGTYYLSPLLQFPEAKDLHIQQAELAKMAFLERNPKDFDNADLLTLMFLKPASVVCRWFEVICDLRHTIYEWRGFSRDS